MKKLLTYLEGLVPKFLLGNMMWAQLRLVAILFSWLLWLVLIKAVFESYFEGIRYLILPIGIILSVIALGARYVQDIYNLKSYSAAILYIFASFFGFGYSKIRIEHGKKEIDSDVLGLLETIGGPGYVDVLPGNVVLLESWQGPSGVCANGYHFLPRFDRIGAIIDLEEQQYAIDKLEAVSKDGIPVVVKNIYCHYRLLAPPNRVRTVSDPYPFSVQAVRNFAYSRAVISNQLTPWEIAVKLAVNSAISDYINEHQIDQITAPSPLERNPRSEIGSRIKSPSIRNRLKSFGTELTWFDIGEINAADEVDLQRLKAWQAKWNEQSTRVRAEGEAQRIAFQEVGRVETQADLLKSILSSFRSVHVSDSHKENVRKIVMARTAQILDAMSSLYQNSDGDLVSPVSHTKPINTKEVRNGAENQNDKAEKKS